MAHGEGTLPTEEPPELYFETQVIVRPPVVILVV